MARERYEGVQEHSILGQGSRFQGTLEVQGVLRVESRFEGTIRSEGQVTVGPSAVVEGDICARKVIVQGTVKGSITATERLELQEKAHVEADLVTPRLSMSETTFFQGQCRMDGKGAAGEVPGTEKLPGASVTPLQEARR